MASLIKNILHTNGLTPIRKIGCVTLLVSLLFLSGCELPDFPSLFDRSQDTPELDAKDDLKSEKPDPLLKEPPFVSNESLFTRNVRNNDDRFRRLEIELQKLRDNFDNVEPSIKRLSGIESELTELMQQIKSSLAYNPSRTLQERMAAPPTTNTKSSTAPITKHTYEMPQSEPKPPQFSAQQHKGRSTAKKPSTHTASRPVHSPSTKSGDLRRIRMGDHAGKTRIVIETSKTFKPSVTVNKETNQLIVSYPSGQAALDVSKTPIASKNVTSVSKTENPDGGFTLTFSLKQGSSLLTQGFIKPNHASKNHRHFIDVSR